MSTHNIPFSVYKRKSPKIILNLQLWDFSKGLKNEFETAVVNEPSVFKPLKFYFIKISSYTLQFHFYSLHLSRYPCSIRFSSEGQTQLLQHFVLRLIISLEVQIPLAVLLIDWKIQNIFHDLNAAHVLNKSSKFHLFMVTTHQLFKFIGRYFTLHITGNEN